MTQFLLPVIDLSSLSSREVEVATQLGRALETDGFAYLTNLPLTFDQEHVFSLARSFFHLPEDEKFRLAKTAFRRDNDNTYRGYFPVQTGSDNLKESFEVGPSVEQVAPHLARKDINLTEANVWPPESSIPGFKEKTEKLHQELQSLSSILLSLIATALGKESSYFEHYLTGSVSTLRYLHYPPVVPPALQQGLCCTPHTDSGILTLLHQDSTGGLEVLSPAGIWTPAPPVPGSLVVNIGDLMAKVSNGRFRATLHRVRSSPGRERYSVPFFFEPGVACAVRSVAEDDEVVTYGEHVLSKMSGWVEFQA